MRRLLANLSLALVAVLFTLFLLELGFRLIDYDPIGVLLEGNHGGSVDAVLRPSDNPALRYEMVPGSQGIAYGTEVTINSHGMRDREYSLEKPPDKYRVAVFGDSETFGIFLEIDEVYTEVLESRLAEAGHRIEVLNFGVGGYDTVQEVALLESRGVAFDPDLVVLGYCMNDVGVASGNLKHIQNRERYGSLIYRSRVVQFVARKLERIVLARETEMANEIERFVADFADSIDPIDDDPALLALVDRLARLLEEDEPRHVTVGWYAAPERVGRLRFTLRRLAELSREHEFDVALLIFPYLRAQEEVHRVAYDIVRHEAERQGVAVIEVVEEFVAAGIEGLRSSPNDLIHPNAAGHAIVAGALFEHLTARLEVASIR